MTCGRTSSCRSGISLVTDGSGDALLRRQRLSSRRRPSEGPRTASVFAAIFRWARRWNLKYAVDMRSSEAYVVVLGERIRESIVGTPVRSTDAADHVAASSRCRSAARSGSGRTEDQRGFQTRRPYRPTRCRRPRDHVHFVWFVRNRVCHPPTPIAQLAAGAARPRIVTSTSIRYASR